MTGSALAQPLPATAMDLTPPSRRSWPRKIATLIVLVFLLAVIGAYVYVTDSVRVRAFSERYLGDLVGSRVTVANARLSIFEGLRLEEVKILVEDAPFFEAKSMQIDYSPRGLLGGRIVAGRILVIEPHVRSIENLDRDEWNFGGLYRHQAANAAKPALKPDPKMHWPQILLRNARMDFAQTVKGQTIDVGTLFLEGQVTPESGTDYRFALQSRGDLGGVFPVADGRIRFDGTQGLAEVRDVNLIDEIKTLLPTRVRQFWDTHRLSGTLKRTRFEFVRPPNAAPAFRWSTELAGLNVTIPSSEWMQPGDHARVQRWRDAYSAVAEAGLGGSAMAAGLVDAMAPPPLVLNDVDATLVFTDDRIRIDNLVVRLDNNRLKITGHVDGYSDDAPYEFHIGSLPDSPLKLMTSPTFIHAMPWPGQEIFYRFKPVGTATFFLDLTKSAHAAKPTLHGELAIQDAAFAFDRFPYLADRATGVLRFESDPATGDAVLQIENVKAHGYTGGPNETANVALSGKITPLDARAGAEIHIIGDGIVSEPKLVEAMPPPTQKAVHNFDSNHTGTLPKFAGAFDCTVHRGIGLHKPWLVTTQLDISKGEGSFVGFPYAVKNVGGRLTIFDDHLDIASVDLPCNDGQATLSGSIFWKKRNAVTGEPLVQTDLKIVAKHVAFDEKLLNALPPGKSAWLRKLALRGHVDLAGKIIPSAPESDDPAVNLSVRLFDASAGVTNGKGRVEKISAEVVIDPDHVAISNLQGVFGSAAVRGTADIKWAGDDPQFSASGNVTNLALDDRLLSAMPPNAAKALTVLHASGSIDADLDYDPGRSGGYRAELRPRELSLKPDFLPMAFTDVKGSVLVEPDRFTLKSLTASVEKGAIAASGQIATTTGDATLALSGRDLALSRGFVRALPQQLREIAQSASLTGTVAFDCSELKLHGLGPTTRPARADADDVSFNTKIWLQPVDLQLGMPMTDVRGVISLKADIDGVNVKSLDGDLALDSMKIAGRTITDMTAVLRKPLVGDVLQIGKIDARIAGGQVAGQIDTSLSKTNQRFALNLQVRGTKVSELTGEVAKNIDGRLNASLAMEGKWSDTASRHGSGDVIVEGRDMYRVPVLFGLMQVANLTLPNSTPLRQAAVRYTVEGPRLIMDQIDLRARESVMQGSGEMNFDTKAVNLQFSLANSAADAVPIFGDILRSARQELLQIRIRGTLEAPTVQANAFNLFNTTVDEVKNEK